MRNLFSDFSLRVLKLASDVTGRSFRCGRQAPEAVRQQEQKQRG